jgi:hypothetical protein
MEEEAPAASGRAASRRRNTPRPRRPRRNVQEGAADDAQPSGDAASEAPVLAASE